MSPSSWSSSCSIRSGPANGCVVVPQAIEAEVIERALAKVAGENTVRDVLAAGASIREVFKDYGIL
jgi:4-hydroxy-4-methyl-2-oxoglutarate aldolase